MISVMTCALRVRGVPPPRRSMRASVPEEIRALRRSEAARLLLLHPLFGRIPGLVDAEVLLLAAELQRHRLRRTSV